MATNASQDLVPMNGGDGHLSYTQNSSFQREGIRTTKVMIDEAIAEKLDINHTSSDHFTIADFGCSTGLNSFLLVENVIKAVELKYKQQCPSLTSDVPEFQVYFNDHVANDFNTLFKTLPSKKQYSAAGVPGSFYGRLFPKASLNFVHSSYALHWLSMIPNELKDKSSSAWNKGRITYKNAPNEVVEAYSAQYAKDMGSFLNARAHEIVQGGLMALLLIATPDEISSSESTFISLFDLMGSSLMDMASLGIVSEDAVDSFNLPVYNTRPQESKSLVETNGCFTIEKMEPLFRLPIEAETCAKHVRAGGFEQLVKEHFGSEILDDFFQRFARKIMESCIISNADLQIHNELFLVLKRKIARA